MRSVSQHWMSRPRILQDFFPCPVAAEGQGSHCFGLLHVHVLKEQSSRVQKSRILRKVSVCLSVCLSVPRYAQQQFNCSFIKPISRYLDAYANDTHFPGPHFTSTCAPSQSYCAMRVHFLAPRPTYMQATLGWTTSVGMSCMRLHIKLASCSMFLISHFTANEAPGTYNTERSDITFQV